MESEWDDFVSASRNGTFLFHREYVEHSGDRFIDASLVLHDRHSVVALLPANLSGDLVHSHAGLTHGGFVVGNAMTTPLMLEAFDALLAHLRTAGADRLRYATIPHIYHRYPCEEDLYALFRLGATVVRRNVLSVVTPGDRPALQNRRRRGVRRAGDAGLSVGESSDWRAYWRLLEENLESRYAATPVHSLEEITRLQGRFPGKIRLFVCASGPDLVAGTVIYETDRVARTQYIASNEEGRASGAVDLLFSVLLDDVFSAKPYFEFGSSNLEDGQILVQGLIEQKEGFGARTVIHDTYELKVA